MGEPITYYNYEDENYYSSQETITIQREDIPFLESENVFHIRQRQVKSLLSLPANWDGYNSLTIFPEIGEIAMTLLNTLHDYELEQISDIYPNPNGTISFEWENTFNEKLSLELGKENFSYFVKYRTGNPKLIDGTNVFSHTQEIKQDIKQLFAQANS